MSTNSVWPSGHPLPAKTYEPWWELSITPVFQNKYRVCVTEHDSAGKSAGFWMLEIAATALPDLPPIPEIRSWIKTQVPEQNAQFESVLENQAALKSLTLDDLF